MSQQEKYPVQNIISPEMLEKRRLERTIEEDTLNIMEKLFDPNGPMILIENEDSQKIEIHTFLRQETTYYKTLLTIEQFRDGKIVENFLSLDTDGVIFKASLNTKNEKLLEPIKTSAVKTTEKENTIPLSLQEVVVFLKKLKSGLIDDDLTLKQYEAIQKEIESGKREKTVVIWG